MIILKGGYKTIEKNEIWKPVNYNGFGDYYEVSNFGRVKSLERDVWHPHPRCKDGGFNIHLKEKILNPRVSNNNKGYLNIDLNRDGVAYETEVHVLVYSAFVEDIPDGMTINHKDGDKLNDTLDNLELATYSENNQHAYDVLNKTREKEFHTYYITDIETNKGMEFRYATEAGKYFGVAPETIKAYATGHFKGVFRNKYIIERIMRSSK